MKDYTELVKSIAEGPYDGETYSQSFENCKGSWEEINAWTYWQGMGVRKCKILLIGQDWGSIEKSKPYFDAIQWIQEHGNPTDKVYYFNCIDSKQQVFDTDDNLEQFFEVIGYPNIKAKHYDDLFFTNLLPGFRTDSESTGKFRKSWVTDKVKNDLKDLVEILDPRIIICLGKDVFEQVAKIYGEENILGEATWNDYLNRENNHLMIRDDKTAVFPVAHPGYFGQQNRKKEGDPVSDWNKISEFNRTL